MVTMMYLLYIIALSLLLINTILANKILNIFLHSQPKHVLVVCLCVTLCMLLLSSADFFQKYLKSAFRNTVSVCTV